MTQESTWTERLGQLQRGADAQAVEAHCLAWVQHVPDATQPWLVLVNMQLRSRRLAQARESFERVIALDPRCLPAFVQLAIVCRAERLFEQELTALKAALAIDPYDLLALLAKGDCLMRLELPAQALQAWRAASLVASQADSENLGLEIQRMLRHARSVLARNDRQFADALDDLVAREGGQLRGAARERFTRAIDLLLGRSQRFDPQPMGLFYPSLVQGEFFPRERFPWLSELEAKTEEIRTEFLQVLGQDLGFEPYLQYDSDQPTGQWGELNRNPAWSAFHLIKEGERVEVNAQRCPRTMEALASLPQPHQSKRTPVALFSCLKPNTRIPPHVGVSNARLLVHLPLIVPPKCAFRVGAQTREWREGEAFVFDDSIEHEAWNLSDRLRVVLICDVWHPDLSEEEQHLLDQLSRIQNRMVAPES